MMGVSNIEVWCSDIKLRALSPAWYFMFIIFWPFVTSKWKVKENPKDYYNN